VVLTHFPWSRGDAHLPGRGRRWIAARGPSIRARARLCWPESPTPMLF